VQRKCCPHTSQTIDLSKVTCRVSGTQCTARLVGETGERVNGVCWANLDDTPEPKET